MIKSFSCKETFKIFKGERSIRYGNIQKIAKRKLDMVHYAYKEQDLIVPPANRFEHLKGNFSGYCSVRINDQYRIMFKFADGYAEEAQIIDYH